MAKTSFSIIANVTFAIPAFMKGAFNAHHKANLQKDENGKGKVTETGAKFFSNRVRLDDKQLAEELKTNGYVLAPLDGVEWPINKTGQKWQAGQGKIGQTVFVLALSALTQAATKAATKAASKPAQKTATTSKPKDKANALPSKPKAASKPRALVTVKA